MRKNPSTGDFANVRILAWGLLAFVPTLGCGVDPSNGEGSGETSSSSEELSRSRWKDEAPLPDGTCDEETDVGDSEKGDRRHDCHSKKHPVPDGVPGLDPPAVAAADPPVAIVVPSTDCGAQSTTACRVTTAFSGTFTNLQTAINRAVNGDVLTVTGHCGSAIVSNRIGLTITGPTPALGCGFNGPTGTQLRGTIDGLVVRGSTNITARFLNFVHATNGLVFDSTVTSSAICNCAAFNSAAGVRLVNTRAATVSQTLAEANAIGLQGTGTSTVIFGNNTVRANTQAGILVQNSFGDVVSANIVTNNVPGVGVLFSNVNTSIASGNTINSNGDGLVNLINCQNSHATGNNVPRGCL